MESVSNAIKRLMINEPFYGIFLSGLRRNFSNEVKKMGVSPDGYNYQLNINKDAWGKLDMNHKMGLLKHNILHLCFFHVTEYRTYLGLAHNRKEVVQVAMDLEVNSYVDEDCWPEDSSVDLFKKYPNLPKRQGTKFYIQLLNDVLDGTQMAGDPNQWGLETDSILEALAAADTDDRSWENLRTTTETARLQRAQLEYRMTSVAQGLNRRIPQELQDVIAKLLAPKKAIFNWKKFFRRLIANAIDTIPKSTRRKESNRFVDANGHKLSKKHTILVGVDTSGSIGQKELDDFFSEIYHVWKAGATVDIVEFDMKIQREYHYKGKTPTSVQGRGGTDFHPFLTYFNSNKQKYSLGICFTDGYASLEGINPQGRFCWVISSDGAQNENYPGYKICIPKITE